MKLIVGLGNPGRKYEGTRHNVGFMILDEFMERSNLNWEGEAFGAEYAKGELFGQKCLFIKPQTYMNLSGRSVRQAAQFYKIEPQDIVVIQDDLDMSAMKVKSRTGGSHGGNNGIRSILEELGQDGFHRIKIGIGRPDHRGDEASWVLSRFDTSEVEVIKSEVYDSVMQRLKNLFSQS